MGDVHPGAQTVGDRRDQPGGFRHLVGVRRHPFGRHQHGRAIRPAASCDPGQAHVRRVVRAGRQTESQRVDRRASAERRVARLDARGARKPGAQMHFLAQLAQCADLRLDLRQAVAVAGDGDAVRRQPGRLDNGYAQPV